MDIVFLVALLFSLVILAKAGVSYFRGAVLLQFSGQLGFQMVSNTFAHLLRLPLAYFEKKRDGRHRFPILLTGQYKAARHAGDDHGDNRRTILTTYLYSTNTLQPYPGIRCAVLRYYVNAYTLAGDPDGAFVSPGSTTNRGKTADTIHGEHSVHSGDQELWHRVRTLVGVAELLCAFREFELQAGASAIEFRHPARFPVRPGSCRDDISGLGCNIQRPDDHRSTDEFRIPQAEFLRIGRSNAS